MARRGSGFVRLALAVLLATAAGWIVVHLVRRSEAAAPAIETATVDEGPVEVVLKETGVVKPRQTVAVKSKVSGKVRDVRVAEGDVVRTGDLLAVVEPDAQASLTLSQNRLELRRLRIDLDQREREHRRQGRLAADGLVAAQLAEEAERDWKNAENLFLQARTALNLLEREANQKQTTAADAKLADPGGLTDYRILAPMDGVVSSVRVKPGELATSGTTGLSQEGALLMEIADERELEVVVNVNEIDVPKVKPGMGARVQLAARPGKPIAATVARVAVAPVASPATTDAGKLVVYAVALALPERPVELRQGMTAVVDFTLESVAKAVRIPLLAFEDREGKAYVKLRSAAGTFADREVTLGLKSDRFAEVKQGLQPKDVVAQRYRREDAKDAKK